ncbi:hypothetical protein HYPSUDRAFT_452805, partial [Hypholoma sublateritium FD-334 SS-4]
LILKEEEDRQRTWYNSGIGTYARPSWKSLKFYRQAIYHKVDLAIAWNFERTVLAAYRWLSDNYERGDCIFLFGFSRGAFQVRVLSAMIDKVGLIYKGNEMQIPFAFELYSDPESDKTEVTQVGLLQNQEKMSSAERFKETFSYKDVKVHFVGVWDTVSSIGLARGTQMLPRTVDGMQHVCYFRHALALDERRVKFLPEYAYGGSTKPPPTQKPEMNPSTNPASENNIRPDPTTNPVEVHPHTLEVWFAGTHSDIGGGNVENVRMDRSRPPLRWMVFEAGALGLRTAQFKRKLSLDEETKIEVKESLKGFWWFLELLPLKRLTYTRREMGIQTTRKPHLGSRRKIHEGQKIHSSILLAEELIKGEYIPKARPLNDNIFFWNTANLDKGLGQSLELELCDYIDNVVKRFITNFQDGTSPELQTLHQTASWADGQEAVCEALYRAVISALKDGNYKPEMMRRLLQSTTDILSKSSRELKLTYSAGIRALVPGPCTSDDANYQQTVKHFIEQCTTDSCIYVFREHTDYVNSVAFSPDGTFVASGSEDDTIRVWNSKTGKQVGMPATGGHTDWVNSVAFSPNGKNVVSGSDDRTVRIWDSETGKQVGQPFVGHTGYVNAVAFSPDGTHVLSGSADDTIRSWDLKTGKQAGEPMEGHANWVRSIAISPDGKYAVSGSDDQTVCIWNLETRDQVGQPFRGHTGYVRSVAFSPNGNRIASGSQDETVRIWDTETGKQVGEPLRGHTDCVNAVTFSPDGHHIVSSSNDKTIRIWDSETGVQVRELVGGHTDHVKSVKFSPDGNRIVSGSRDATVRIWDVNIW